MKVNSADEVIVALERCIARFGMFKKLRSDAGNEFFSRKSSIVWLNSKGIQFYAYPPEGQNTNGVTERYYETASNLSRNHRKVRPRTVTSLLTCERTKLILL